MSFSELFDQELFSTHENKDCKLTIKIEKEEPLNPCYSADNSQDTSVCHSPVKTIENTSSSTSSKSFAPKRGINRTSIKITKNCDVERLIHNPFYESDNLDDQLMVKVRKPSIKCKPVDSNDIEQNIVGLEVIPGSANDSQNNIDDHSLINIVNGTQFALSKNTQKDSAINNISLKSTLSYDIQCPMDNEVCELDSLVFDQIETPTTKYEPEEANDLNEKDITNMEINPYYSSENLQNQVYSHDLVKGKNNIQPLTLKSSTSKFVVLDKNSLKIIKNYGTKNLENLAHEKTPVKINTPIMMHEPEEINDIIEQEINMEINPYSTEASQNQMNSYSSVERNDSVQPSLVEISAPLNSVLNKPSLKPSKICDIKNSMSNSQFEAGNQNFDQLPLKVISFAKFKPDNINDVIEQTIEMEMKECFSFGDSKKKTDKRRDVNINNTFTPLLSKDFTPKHQVINRTPLKPYENSNVNCTIYPSFCEPGGPINVKAPVINCEQKDLNHILNQKSVGMEIHLREENLLNNETSKYTSLDDFCCNNLNCTKIESQNIPINKKESNVSSITFVKNVGIETIGNDITLETEKKKISWEEYKAKIGKSGFSKILENSEEPVTDIAATSNDKLNTVIEEFDRNTAEYLIGQKRKIEDKGPQIINAKEMSSVEDLELQNKRMKIEYIKQLLPSSFASEIAKTSSLMKGNNYVDDIENESTSDDSIMSSNKSLSKMTDGYFKKDEKSQKKFHQTRVHSSYRSSSRTDYCTKSSRLSSSSSSSSSNPDDYYNRNRIDTPLNGQYNQNIPNTVQRSRDQKRVVYVGQIPIKFGKRYLYNRFKVFGTIQSLTLHKKPDFRVYYAFVTYSEKSEAERAINHGNDDKSQVQLDIRFGERKQTQTPYYDLDDEWLTDWYGYNQPVQVVKPPSPGKTSFEEELQEFYKLAQIKKSNQIKPSQVS